MKHGHLDNECVYVRDKHGRVMGVTIHNQLGAAAVRKSFCRSHRHQLVILFNQDHKKVCDMTANDNKKLCYNGLNMRLNGQCNTIGRGLIVQTGISSTKLHDSYNSAQIAYYCAFQQTNKTEYNK